MAAGFLDEKRTTFVPWGAVDHLYYDQGKGQIRLVTRTKTSIELYTAQPDADKTVADQRRAAVRQIWLELLSRIQDPDKEPHEAYFEGEDEGNNATAVWRIGTQPDGTPYLAKYAVPGPYDFD